MDEFLRNFEVLGEGVEDDAVDAFVIDEILVHLFPGDAHDAHGVGIVDGDLLRLGEDEHVVLVFEGGGGGHDLDVVLRDELHVLLIKAHALGVGSGHEDLHGDEKNGVSQDLHEFDEIVFVHVILKTFFQEQSLWVLYMDC